MYSIPLANSNEYKTLGTTLNIEIDLEDLKPSYTLDIQKYHDKIVKSNLAPPVYRAEDWGCCPKK